MNLNLIFTLIYVIAGFLVAAIPESIALYKAIKAKRTAKDDATREAAKNDMLDKVNQLILSAEMLYANVDAALKQRGDSAGSVKKDSVLSKLQAYAIANDYEFDTDFWSNKIDEIVYLTRNVNK